MLFTWKVFESTLWILQFSCWASFSPATSCKVWLHGPQQQTVCQLQIGMVLWNLVPMKGLWKHFENLMVVQNWFLTTKQNEGGHCTHSCPKHCFSNFLIWKHKMHPRYAQKEHKWSVTNIAQISIPFVFRMNECTARVLFRWFEPWSIHYV